MAELARMLQDLGLSDVRTLLQSGNAAVCSEWPETALTERVRSAFREKFGFDGGVLARGASDLLATLNAQLYRLCRTAAHAIDQLLPVAKRNIIQRQ